MEKEKVLFISLLKKWSHSWKNGIHGHIMIWSVDELLNFTRLLRRDIYAKTL